MTGIVLSYCFQCAHDRNVAEQERRFRESDARPALGAAYEWRSKSASERSACWEKEGYDNFEDWYYAEMDVVGEGEYPDM